MNIEEFIDKFDEKKAKPEDLDLLVSSGFDIYLNFLKYQTKTMVYLDYLGHLPLLYLN